MEKHTFIYSLSDPRTEAVRYVGKANVPKRRLRAHINHARSGKGTWHSAAWVRSLLDDDIEPILGVLEEVPFEEWQAAERKWIAKLRAEGCDLVNTAEGGFGGAITEESRAKMSAAAKRRKRRPMSEETKARMIASKTGRKRGPMPAEWRAKIGAAQKGRAFSDEYRAKIAEGQRRRWQRQPISSEQVAKMQEGGVRYRENLEVKPGRPDSLEQFMTSPEYAQQRSDAVRKSWATRKAKQQAGR